MKTGQDIKWQTVLSLSMMELDTLRNTLGITFWYLENHNIWQPLPHQTLDKTVFTAHACSYINTCSKYPLSYTIHQQLATQILCTENSPPIWQVTTMGGDLLSSGGQLINSQKFSQEQNGPACTRNHYPTLSQVSFQGVIHADPFSLAK